MTKYIERIIDIATGETTEREFTALEIAEVEAEQAKSQLFAAELAAKAAAKAAVLEKLGLTADEAAVLFS